MARRDDMIRQLQERFMGHEMPVDPGMWNAIAGQLAVGAGASDGVEQCFRDRFDVHGGDVGPGVWDAISGQLGYGAAAGGTAAGGWGTVTGWAAAGVATVVIVGAAVLWMRQGSETNNVAITQQPPAEQVTQVAEAPVATSPEILDLTTYPTTSQPTVPKAQAAIVPQDAPDPETEDPVPANTPDLVAADPTPNNTAAITAQGQEVVVAIRNEMVAEADKEVMKPATVPDPVLQESGPQQAPPTLVVEAAAIPDVVEETSFPLFLPNVFTPGHDGINDEYLPVGEGIVDAKIRVYAVSTGELVFSADAMVPWNGTFFNSGQSCPEGHYFYAIEVIGTDGRVRTHGQTVRLFR